MVHGSSNRKGGDSGADLDWCSDCVQNRANTFKSVVARADKVGAHLMIWFFTRGAAQVDIEVRQLPRKEAWELIVDYPDGSETVERFGNPRRLVECTLKLQRELIRDGWMPTGPGRTGLRLQRPVADPPRVGRLRGIALLLAHVHRDLARRLSAALGL